MKSQRRHELQTNRLADSLGKSIEATRPYMRWIGLGALAVILVVFVGAWISSRNQTAAGNAWSDYFRALSSTDRQVALRDVSSVYPNSSAAIWADLATADFNLGQGCQIIYQNRDEADKALNQAIGAYQRVLDSNPRDTFLIQRAQFGLGLAHETLGKLKDASQAYEKVIQQGELTAVAALAKNHLDMLKRDEVKSFYDWFVAQKSAPDLGGGLPGMPGDLNGLPDFPDLKIGNPPSSSGDGTGGSPPKAP
ncbi:MAG: tetratricopeptide repeat protein [Planctomycetes bacterium]|nr:tetratricopeptide repeat protein [Planctomycetota bacterium]